MTSQTGWIIVVERSRADLYACLRRRFGTRGQLILDRREASTDGVRRRERRRPMTVADAAAWRDFGYHLAFEPGAPAGEQAEVKAEVHALAMLGRASRPR